MFSHVAYPVGFWDIRDWVAEVSLKGVTSNHLEILGEGRDSGVARIGVQEIVARKRSATKLKS